MKVDNPLSREFLLGYPVEAARALEQVSAEHVAALFTALPPQTGVPVLTVMLPERAAACLGMMAALPAAKLMSELPVSSAARIYRLLAHTKQDEVSANLPDKTRKRIRRNLEYPVDSAGALLDTGIYMLPESVTVVEALHRIEHIGHAVSCEIYIIDAAHHLVGMIDLGRLLTSPHHVRLRDIMSRKTHPVSVHAVAGTLLSHPGWETRRRLPMVERDNTLVGVLDYKYLRDSIEELDAGTSQDPMGNLLALAGLYWLSMIQLLDSVLSVPGSDKGERQ